MPVPAIGPYRLLEPESVPSFDIAPAEGQVSGMRGSFTRTTEVTAAPEEIWATIHDVDRLAGFSSHLGPVTVITDDRRWQVSLHDRVGPFKLSAPMDIELVAETDRVEVSIRASGKDRGPGTRLEVEASVRIDQTKHGSGLTLEGSYDLKGRIARLGGPVAKQQAETMIDEFWSNLTGSLQA